ncbi:hypothetical protein A374_16518 [Fictibacillus macauensis ZFHKF-1]|uniref:DUF2651 domain-containing protein n=1 Tax=Fictibacillus macauensis ZFHKF-1 TaxID=1196324 RepID=I8UBA5_9BACL|nr:DUF2651 family protein [Fictibacillus macauensis]EIT84225.1 hypothetical protein A374_16518 [Fictibacillus macauensis ZFHKF-1]
MYIVFVVLPLVVLAASVLGWFLFRRWYVVPLLTLVTLLVLTYTQFNSSFLIWAVFFPVYSAAISILLRQFSLLRNRKKTV